MGIFQNFLFDALIAMLYFDLGEESLFLSICPKKTDRNKTMFVAVGEIWCEID